MLTQIDVVFGNELGEQALALPILGVTPKESLLIRKVTGLNPPDRDLFIGEYARDGGNYQGSRVGNRNVVMTLDLNPNPALGETVSGLRDLLYKTFMDPLIDADHVELVLHDDDGRLRNLYGYTEKLETEIFDIETMAQVSMICPDPFIRDVSSTVLTNSGGTWVTVPFVYGGTAETGFEAMIYFSVPSGTLTLKNNAQKMVLTHSFAATSAVYINTNRGSRDVRLATQSVVDAYIAANPTLTLTEVWANLVAAGSTTPLIGKLSPDSPWIELHSQTNKMTVYGLVEPNPPTTTGDLVAGVKTLTYRASYWGV